MAHGAANRGGGGRRARVSDPQKHKVYVQNRLLENKKRVYDLLQDGGYFYVCGYARSACPSAAVHAVSNGL